MDRIKDFLPTLKYLKDLLDLWQVYLYQIQFLTNYRILYTFYGNIKDYFITLGLRSRYVGMFFLLFVSLFDITLPNNFSFSILVVFILYGIYNQNIKRF